MVGLIIILLIYNHVGSYHASYSWIIDVPLHLKLPLLDWFEIPLELLVDEIVLALVDEGVVS